MPDIEMIAHYIINNEGYEPRVYPDPLLIPSIGVGFCLDLNKRPDARDKIEALGYNYEMIINGSETLSREHIAQLLRNDINTAIEGARSLFANFDHLDPVRQTVLVDMAFQMGHDNFSDFRTFRAAVESDNWDGAAHAIQRSLYYRQDPRRAYFQRLRHANGRGT